MFSDVKMILKRLLHHPIYLKSPHFTHLNKCCVQFQADVVHELIISINRAPELFLVIRHIHEEL